MELAVSPRRHRSDAVTLISYADSTTGAKPICQNNNNNYVQRFTSNSITSNGSNSYTVAPPCVAKKSEKFLRTFRRRSKSATRIRETEASVATDSSTRITSKAFGGSVLTLNEDSESESGRKSSITYVANGERARNPDRCVKPDKVTLVGFTTKSTCNLLSLSGDSETTDLEPRLKTSQSTSGFTTLKTSREVKMERERLRQERLQKLTQETKDWFDKVKQESRESSNVFAAHQKLFNAATAHMAEERARFFEEARERFHSKMSNGTSDEIFGTFVRENQERFNQLLSHQQSSTFSRLNSKAQPDCAQDSGNQDSSCVKSTTTTTTTAADHGTLNGSAKFTHRALSRDRGRDFYNSNKIDVTNNQPSAAEVVASLLSDRGYATRIPLRQRLVANSRGSGGKQISKKDLIESNAVRVHTIKVQRETEEKQKLSGNINNSQSGEEQQHTVNTDEKLEKKSETLQRTHSGSSGLSSSSSSGFSSLGGNSVDHKQSDLHAKFRQLLEKKNSCEHHPSFSNHFVGFAKNSGPNSSEHISSFGSFPSFTHRPLVLQHSADGAPLRVPPPTPILQHKVDSEDKMTTNIAVTKSNSSNTQFADEKADNTYSHTEETVMSSGYGDSETESDDDDEVEEDFYDLDSVSVVDERHTNLSNVSTQQKSDADSGRGGSPSCSSPASSSSSTVVSSCAESNKNCSIIRNGARKTSKTSRPISAVPSELSDISYTTSDDAGIEDDSEESTHQIVAELKSVDGHCVEGVKNRLSDAHRIALEILSTEKQYVSVLNLIDQEFHFRVDRENRVSKMFPQETLVQIFANIKPIYQFHSEFVLPQLLERMKKWDEDPMYQKIGDIMVKFSHFFKMYTEYVKNFENARNTINVLYQKNSKFAAIVDEIHAMPECRNLTIQQHMLTPIQRIPRYEMLLKKYLTKLPEDSTDRADSEQALQLVSAAAAHANDAMKRTEKFKKVLEVQETLGNTIDLVSPTRELIREGKIVKISARSGDHQDRYLFLFTDLLLLCSPRLISNRVISRPAFRLRARFEVDNMQVLEGDNLVTENTFYIRDDHKSVELYTHTPAEKDEWVEALFKTIKDLYRKKSSLKIGREMLKPLESEIGKKQPRLLKLESIQKCMDCGTQFTMMKKKHNCRACGIVVCQKCSNQKYPLQFEENKSCRVCRACHHLLNLHAEKEKSLTEQQTNCENQVKPEKPIVSREVAEVPVRPKGLLEMGRSIKIGYKGRTSEA